MGRRCQESILQRPPVPSSGTPERRSHLNCHYSVSRYLATFHSACSASCANRFCRSCSVHSGLGVGWRTTRRIFGSGRGRLMWSRILSAGRGGLTRRRIRSGERGGLTRKRVRGEERGGLSRRRVLRRKAEGRRRRRMVGGRVRSMGLSTEEPSKTSEAIAWRCS